MQNSMMKTTAKSILTITFLFIILNSDALAQATGMPTFYAPVRGFGSWEAGASVSRPGGSATGLEARYGAALNRADIGLRAGYVESGRSGSLALGIEARIPMIGHTRTFPLDGSLILGAGYLFEGNGQLIVPVGFSLGRRIRLDGQQLHLTPYLQPTVIFEDGAMLAVGLGFDVHISGLPNIRLAWAFADMGGFSVGAFFPR
jgi:hypothetical protein